MPVSDQGYRADRFQVIPRSLIFVFNSEDQVLLLKGAKDKKIWAGSYNGIGGHVEAGEDILTSARRELLEETGISGAGLRLCGQVMVEVDSHRGIALFVFKGRYAGGELKPSDEGSLEWIDLADITKLPLVEDLPILLPRVSRYAHGDPLFFGHYHYDDGKLVMSFH
jgi:8-oxo-dGTP diphosphatase